MIFAIPIVMSMASFLGKAEFRTGSYDVTENKKIFQGRSVTAESLFDCLSICTRENCCSAGYEEISKTCTYDTVNTCEVPFTAEGWQFIQRSPNESMGCNSCLRYEQSMYRIVMEEVNWQTAVVNCQSIGGKLVEIESEPENNFIKNNLVGRNTPAFGCWLGGKRYYGRFEWISNPNVTMPFSNFSPGEPNNPYIELCLLALKHYTFQWGDADCTITAMYVCEFNFAV